MGAGRDNELDIKLSIGLIRRAIYSSVTAVRSSDWLETIPRPTVGTRVRVGPAVVAAFAIRDAASDCSRLKLRSPRRQ